MGPVEIGGDAVEFPTLAAADALEVLDAFRALGKTERGRVYGFVHDALMRQSEPNAAALFAIMEAFQMFIDEYVTGTDREKACQILDLTPDQHDRYERAWRTIQSVHEEVQASCFQRYGSEPTIF